MLIFVCTGFLELFPNSFQRQKKKSAKADVRHCHLGELYIKFLEVLFQFRTSYVWEEI